MRPRKSTPPSRRTGRGGGRKLDAKTVEAMRVVANNPDEWFQIAHYSSTGSASSAANRMRSRDWEEVLGLVHPNGRDKQDDNRYVWDIVSRTFDDRSKGAGVWAKRRTAIRRA